MPGTPRSRARCLDDARRAACATWAHPIAVAPLRGRDRRGRGHTSCTTLGEMNRAERENTAPIKLDELQRLLNAMTPLQQQAITTRARVSEIEAELARVDATARAQPAKVDVAATTQAEVPRLFNGVDLDAFLTETMSMMVTPGKRKSASSSSQVAALLPPREPTRSPRPKRPPPSTRARSLAVPEHKAPRTVTALGTQLDSGETAGAASSVLSPQVLAHLSAEELAMLPAEIRGELPVPAEDTPPRIEMTPAPCAEVVDPPSQLARRPCPRRTCCGSRSASRPSSRALRP
ncbi:MAG: hypothetical protein JWP01_1931 [Myxococcales bacterium]|nr:hypothetical protein [Myxococcales bacterium]